MPNPVDALHLQMVDKLRVERERMAQYTAQYTEQDARRLGDAYLQFPWVNAEILVATVLSGNDDLLPRIADYAAVQGAKSGWSPSEQSARDDSHNNLTGSALTRAETVDTDGDMLLSAMVNRG